MPTERRQVRCRCGAVGEADVILLPDGRALGEWFVCGPCAEQTRTRLDAEERERREREREWRIRDAVAKLRAPLRFESARLASLAIWGSAEQQRCTGRMLQIARRLVGEVSGDLHPPEFVAFVGAPGNGKSTAAWAICNELAWGFGLSVRGIACADLVRDIRGAWRHDDGPDEDTRLRAYIEPAFLAIDEVSSHAFYGQNIHQHLFDVINGRLNALRPTLITSNESEADLAAILRPALWDRLQLGGVVECGRESYRQYAAARRQGAAA